jgi:thiamine pyrophosphate-dependent acetolactate synthase large subunit-like protein
VAQVKRLDAIKTIMTTASPLDVIVSTTGLISREIFEKFDSDRNIYIPGSMGLVSSVALGFAISLPRKRVIAIDGDASLLMNLGSLVTIGNYKPSNLLHIVLDNGAYGSCSEEGSMSDSAQLDKLAIDVGYFQVKKTDSQDELRTAIMEFGDGPSFILAKISLGGRRDFLRPLDLVGIKTRFMRFVTQH